MIEGILFALVGVGFFFLLSLLARAAFDRRVGSPLSYAIVFVCGFILHRVLFIVLSGEPSVASPVPVASTASLAVRGATPETARREAEIAGLPAHPVPTAGEAERDAAVQTDRSDGGDLPAQAASDASPRRFDAPDLPSQGGDRADSPGSTQALRALSGGGVSSRVQAESFLSFGSDLVESEVAASAVAGGDQSVESLMRLYQYGRTHEGTMTDQAMIDLAEEVKRLRPGWWERFEQTQVQQ